MRKIIALFLVLAMSLTLMPFGVFAEGDETVGSYFYVKRVDTDNDGTKDSLAVAEEYDADTLLVVLDHMEGEFLPTIDGITVVANDSNVTANAGAPSSFYLYGDTSVTCKGVVFTDDTTADVEVDFSTFDSWLAYEDLEDAVFNNLVDATIPASCDVQYISEMMLTLDTLTVEENAYFQECCKIKTNNLILEDDAILEISWGGSLGIVDSLVRGEDSVILANNPEGTLGLYNSIITEGFDGMFKDGENDFVFPEEYTYIEFGIDNGVFQYAGIESWYYEKPVAFDDEGNPTEYISTQEYDEGVTGIIINYWNSTEVFEENIENLLVIVNSCDVLLAEGEPSAVLLYGGATATLDGVTYFDDVTSDIHMDMSTQEKWEEFLDCYDHFLNFTNRAFVAEGGAIRGYRSLASLEVWDGAICFIDAIVDVENVYVGEDAVLAIAEAPEGDPNGLNVSGWFHLSMGSDFLAQSPDCVLELRDSAIVEGLELYYGDFPFGIPERYNRVWASYEGGRWNVTDFEMARRDNEIEIYYPEFDGNSIYINGERVTDGQIVDFTEGEEITLTFEFTAEECENIYVDIESADGMIMEYLELNPEDEYKLTPETAASITIAVWDDYDRYVYDHNSPEDDEYELGFQIGGNGDIGFELNDPDTYREFRSSKYSEIKVFVKKTVEEFYVTFDESAHELVYMDYAYDECRGDFDEETRVYTIYPANGNGGWYYVNFEGWNDDGSAFLEALYPDGKYSVYVDGEAFGAYWLTEYGQGETHTVRVELNDADAAEDFKGVCFGQNDEYTFVRYEGEPIEFTFENMEGYNFVEVFDDYYSPFFGEFRVDADFWYRGENYVTVNGTEYNGDGQLFSFEAGEPITVEFFPNEEIGDELSIHAVIQQYRSEDINISDLIEDNVLTFIPESNAPFTLRIWWTDESFVFDNVSVDEDEASVTVWSNFDGATLSGDGVISRLQRYPEDANAVRYIVERAEPDATKTYVVSFLHKIEELYIDGWFIDLAEDPNYDAESNTYTLVLDYDRQFVNVDVYYAEIPSFDLWYDSFEMSVYDEDGNLLSEGNHIFEGDSVTLRPTSNLEGRIVLGYIVGDGEREVMYRVGDLPDGALTLENNGTRYYVNVVSGYKNDIFYNEVRINYDMSDGAEIRLNGELVEPGTKIDIADLDELELEYRYPDGITEGAYVRYDYQYSNYGTQHIDLSPAGDRNVFTCVWGDGPRYAIDMTFYWTVAQEVFDNVYADEMNRVITVHSDGRTTVNGVMPDAMYKNMERFRVSRDLDEAEMIFYPVSNRAVSSVIVDGVEVEYTVLEDGTVSITLPLDENRDFIEVDVICDDIGHEVEPGDLNNDGSVNAIDANLLLKILAGTRVSDGDELRAADVNGDGNVNAIDANLLKRIVAGVNRLS